MVVGIGCDLVRVSRVQASIDKLGFKFAQRILRPEELECFQVSRQSAAYLAKRFASKEAISKALGTGIGAGVSFHDMLITSNSLGQPQVELSGQALVRAQQLGADCVQLSISDEAGMALAFALLATSGDHLTSASNIKP